MFNPVNTQKTLGTILYRITGRKLINEQLTEREENSTTTENTNVDSNYNDYCCSTHEKLEKTISRLKSKRHEDQTR